MSDLQEIAMNNPFELIVTSYSVSVPIFAQSIDSSNVGASVILNGTASFGKLTYQINFKADHSPLNSPLLAEATSPYLVIIEMHRSQYSALITMLESNTRVKATYEVYNSIDNTDSTTWGAVVAQETPYGVQFPPNDRNQIPPLPVPLEMMVASFDEYIYGQNYGMPPKVSKEWAYLSISDANVTINGKVGCRIRFFGPRESPHINQVEFNGHWLIHINFHFDQYAAIRALFKSGKNVKISYTSIGDKGHIAISGLLADTNVPFVYDFPAATYP